MGLKKVTVTGADDKTKIDEMTQISKEYPFVEWGILLSESAMGVKNRYPSLEWIKALYDSDFGYASQNNILSGHICGKWVRDICKGRWTIFDHPVAESLDMFDRFQINFSPYIDQIEDKKAFFKGFGPAAPKTRQFIFQLHDVNHEIVVEAIQSGNNLNVAAIYDPSGGQGKLAPEWPQIHERMYAGYAGGLTPENVKDHLPKMKLGASGHFWIDAESGFRTDDWLDMDKVRKFLENVKEFVDV